MSKKKKLKNLEVILEKINESVVKKCNPNETIVYNLDLLLFLNRLIKKSLSRMNGI